MASQKRRPFLISDGLVLIGATALGLAPMRFLWEAIRLDDNPWRRQPILRAQNLLELHCTPLVILWSICVVFLSFRQPRPRFRILAGTPGFAACFLILVATVERMVYYEVKAVADALAHPLDPPWVHYGNFLTHSMQDAGFMIVGAWIVLSLMGRWGMRTSWLNRLGIVIGLWPVASIAFAYFYWLVRFVVAV